jgi:hypothetical protein
MIYKDDNAHDRIEHRPVSANKRRDHYRDQQLMRHESLRFFLATYET